MEDSLSIVIHSARAQGRLHAPTGNSPAWLEFLSEAGLRMAKRLQGSVEVIYGSGNLGRMQSVPSAHYLGRKVCQLQDSRERDLSVLPLPIPHRRLLGRSPEERQVRLWVAGARLAHRVGRNDVTFETTPIFQEG
jgi:hypothetical protein